MKDKTIKKLKANWFCKLLHFLQVLALILAILYVAMPVLTFLKVIFGLVLGLIFGLLVMVISIFTLFTIWLDDDFKAFSDQCFGLVERLMNDDGSTLIKLQEYYLPFILIGGSICLFSFLHNWIGYSNHKELYKGKFISSLVMLLVFIGLGIGIYFVYNNI